MKSGSIDHSAGDSTPAQLCVFVYGVCVSSLSADAQVREAPERPFRIELFLCVTQDGWFAQYAHFIGHIAMFGCVSRHDAHSPFELESLSESFLEV